MLQEVYDIDSLVLVTWQSKCDFNVGQKQSSLARWISSFNQWEDLFQNFSSSINRELDIKVFNPQNVSVFSHQTFVLCA